MPSRRSCAPTATPMTASIWKRCWLLPASSSPSPTRQGTLLYASIMTMDADRDGSVTAAEFDRGAEKFFRAVDADGNGILSKEEAVAFGERRAAQQQAALRQRGVDRARLRAEARHVACAMPTPTDAARVILQLLPQGDALSTVTLQSQDVVVTTGRLVIDAGDGPLYVILKSGGGTIWQLSGAVERIERLVLAESTTGPNKSDREQTPLAGVIGIAADRVTFLGRPDCIPDFFVPSEMAKGAAEVVRAAIGRAPTLIATYGEGMNIAVPSGQRSGPRSDPLELMVRDDGGMLHIERGPNRVARDDRDVQSSLRRFYENGIVEIDPAAVVASAPVERYTTLPQQAGLIQLVQSGALTEGRPSRPGFPLEFIVNRKIWFPAGLGGSASVKFVIAPGVPMPDGDPMHSCVMLQQTGKAVVNAQTCRYAN